MSAEYDGRPAWKKAAYWVVTVFLWLLIAYVVCSWIPPLRNGPVGDILRMVVGPVLAPFDKIIPSVGGIGFSALIVYFGLSYVQRRFLKR